MQNFSRTYLCVFQGDRKEDEEPVLKTKVKASSELDAAEAVRWLVYDAHGVLNPTIEVRPLPL